MDFSGIASRAWRAAKLDTELYNTVEHDRGYTGEASLIVFFTAILSGIGLSFFPAYELVPTVISAVIGSLLGWLLWAGITLFVGRALGGTADYGEMVRVLGFAHSSRALGILPGFALIGAIWSLVASVVAIREGLDFSTGKAVGTVIIGFLVQFVLANVFGLLL